MREALIVWGGWEGHEPEQCAGIIAEWLREDGFSVALANTTEAFADPSLSDLSLIVPICTVSTIAKQEAANLVAAVAGGVGIAGHHGMAATFRESVEYHFMVGGQWVAHPGNIIDYRVDVTRPDDPVMQGIAGFAYRSEQYYMHVDPSNEVLATTTFSGEHASWIDGVTCRRGNASMARSAAYSSLGHRPASSRCRRCAPS